MHATFILWGHSMSRRHVCTLAISLMVTGCAQQKLVAIRTDGQPMRGDIVLSHAYETDHAVCTGEMQKANMSGTVFHNGGLVNAIAVHAERKGQADDVMAGCLAQKGYVIVSEEEAETRLAHYRAVAEATAQRSSSASANATPITTASGRR
ncbi:MAG: hypothetical protein ACKVP3_17295 [Hyphomicrobiaceae bacterium]